jgi:hypothetical protein
MPRVADSGSYADYVMNIASWTKISESTSSTTNPLTHSTNNSHCLQCDLCDIPCAKCNMVNVSGRSKGCYECRQRKRKVFSSKPKYVVLSLTISPSSAMKPFRNVYHARRRVCAVQVLEEVHSSFILRQPNHKRAPLLGQHYLTKCLSMFLSGFPGIAFWSLINSGSLRL